MKKLIITLLLILGSTTCSALDLITNFEWLEPNNTIEIVVGEPYQLKFNCSNNSQVFTSAYKDSWVHIDFTGGQHVVDPPTGYSIDEKGCITGLVAGSYAIHPTGWVQAKSGVDKWLYINVVSERTEKESNNTLDTANEITSKIRFGLYNTSDIDYFMYTNNNLKWGDEIKFKIHYYGSRENPFGYKWTTFCGTNMAASGSLISQDQECRALVTNSNTVYLEVYFDQSRSQYFNYGEEFVAEVFINGIPANEYGNDNPDDQQNVINGHEYVDLGLPSGKLWAKTNYGASSEGDYGIYIDWPSRNIIQSVWGSEWLTPSHNDILELYNQCTFTWEYNANSVYGCKVTGPNGNSIFLPAAGFKIQGTPQMVGSDIYYWSDNEYEPGFAYALQGSPGSGISAYQTWNTGLAAFPIRPVVAGGNLEPYAVLSDNNTKLTFYYDNHRDARGGMSVGPFDYDEINYKPLSEWYDYSSSIKTVVFDTSFAACHDITSTAYWFHSFRNLVEIRGLSNLNTENVTDMKQMFLWCSNLTTLDLSNFNTENVTDMSHMFSRCISIENLNLESFNTKNVINMDGMFVGCSNLIQLDLSNFNTENVIDMGWMFQQCSSIENLNLETFNTKNVVTMKQMFDNCTNLRTLDLSGFNTEKVTDMGWMFYQCSNIEILDLSNFNTCNVTDIDGMFDNCYNLTTIYSNKDWQIDKVPQTAFVFYHCYNLIGGQGTKWKDGNIYPIYARIDKGPSAPGYFTYKESHYINRHEYVDLGLPSGLLWATTNVDANRPEEYGSYFAWGETNPKSEYSWATYKYANGSGTTLTKYCTSYDYGNVDYQEVLEEQDDAATANWGKPWRTPTLSETQELINYCSWTYVTQNGINGYIVTGANGNSIFLPAGGVMQYNMTFYSVTDACIQSATIFNASNGKPSSASVLYIENGSPHYWYGWSRCWGYNVRPVTNYNPSGINVTFGEESNEVIGIYDLQGHKREGLIKGINIIRYNNGTFKKMMVK